MKKLLLLVQLCFLKAGFAQSNTSTIRAEITGIGCDTIYIMYQPLSNSDVEQKDTIVAINNVITYKLNSNEPGFVAIVPKNSFIKRKDGSLYMPQTKFIQFVFLPSIKADIEGTLQNDYLDYTITGTKINEIDSKLRHSYKLQAIEAVKLELQIDSFSVNENNKDVLTRLYKLRSLKLDEIRDIKFKFIKQNMNSDLSAYYLGRMPLDSFALYYPKLTSKVRNGIFREILQRTYKKYQKYTDVMKAEQNLTEGMLAPDFSLRNQKGMMISLSDFKGKYIVLDFWGSWCAWCIAEYPGLKAFYEKNKFNIEFIGIACKDKIVAWQKAIEINKLPWIQLINSEENDISVLYGVKAYPTKIILDRDLKIIARFVGTDEKFYETLNNLLK